MRKAMLFVMIVAASAFLVLRGGHAATTDHGTKGVSATDLIENIMQLTGNERDNMVPGWGAYPWSSDGEWIVYSCEDEKDYHQICKMKADGTGKVQLTNDPDYGWNSHPSFTPDGSQIVFQRQEGDGEAGYARIWIMDSDGTNPKSLSAVHAGEVSCGEECNNGESKPRVSPDGKKIAFRACGRIWVMNLDGTDPVDVTYGEYKGAGRHSWSPDSQWVLYDIPVNCQRKIFKSTPDGRTHVQLSEKGDMNACENWAAWSPDGEWIAYHRRDYGPDGDRKTDDDIVSLNIMKPDGSGKKPLKELDTSTNDKHVCGPSSWNPCSEWIAFGQYQSINDVTNVSSRESLREGESLCGCETVCGGESLSAVVPFQTTGVRTLYVVNLDTRETIQLTNGGYHDGRQWWSPDGSKILFKDNRGKGRDGDAIDDLLTVNFFPVESQFSVDPTSGFAPLDVLFTDESTGPVYSWLWDFGDGETSTEQNPPVHTYEEAGTYTANLTVGGISACSVTSSSDIEVNEVEEEEAVVTSNVGVRFIPDDDFVEAGSHKNMLYVTGFLKAVILDARDSVDPPYATPILLSIAEDVVCLPIEWRVYNWQGENIVNEAGETTDGGRSFIFSLTGERAYYHVEAQCMDDTDIVHAFAIAIL